MWLEYNLLQETATICLALLYILIESNHLWTIWVTLENRIHTTQHLSGFSIIFATILPKALLLRNRDDAMLWNCLEPLVGHI
jgi:hypothetical protein